MARFGGAGAALVVAVFVVSSLCATFSAEAKGKPTGSFYREFDAPWTVVDAWSYYDWDGSGTGLKDIDYCSFSTSTGAVHAAHGSLVVGLGTAQITMYNGFQGATWTSACDAKMNGVARAIWPLEWEAMTGQVYGGLWVDTEVYIKLVGNVQDSQGNWMLQNNAELVICEMGSGINYQSGDEWYTLEFPVTLKYGETYTFWVGLETYTYAEAVLSPGADAAVSVHGSLLVLGYYGTIVG